LAIQVYELRVIAHTRGVDQGCVAVAGQASQDIACGTGVAQKALAVYDSVAFRTVGALPIYSKGLLKTWADVRTIVHDNKAKRIGGTARTAIGVADTSSRARITYLIQGVVVVIRPVEDRFALAMHLYELVRVNTRTSKVVCGINLVWQSACTLSLTFSIASLARAYTVG